jgi:hypothetical protein
MNRMETETEQSVGVRSFGGARRRAVAPPAERVRSELARAGKGLPLVVRPAVGGLDLTEWAEDHRAFLEAELLLHGALLFRGFAVESPPAFERFARAVCGELYTENGEHVPVAAGGGIQVPVSYPAEAKLLWHNENSFNRTWPGKILFCCEVPPASGGETPLADSREVFSRLSEEVRRPFLDKGVLYVRRYSPHLGLDWRTVFRTADRSAVERTCAEAEMGCEWSGDRLLTRAFRPAVVRHPVSGEVSWFNQAQHWHPACLDPVTRRSLTALLGEGCLPRHCSYGDGSPIPDGVMAEILAAYREAEVSVPWQRGDVLVVDNVLAAHARNPYRGERRILVALGEMRSF